MLWEIPLTRQKKRDPLQFQMFITEHKSIEKTEAIESFWRDILT